jgi:hypothetical protein
VEPRGEGSGRDPHLVGDGREASGRHYLKRNRKALVLEDLIASIIVLLYRVGRIVHLAR